jgi:hypothetical protein
MSSLPLSTTMGDSFHTQMTKVYVSGPMTGYPDYNFPAFHGMEAVLSALGYHTLNPARNFNGEHGHPREDYMRLDIQNVLQADAVVMLPGWTQSVGARTEVMVAHQLGLPLFEASYVDNEQVEFRPVEDLTAIGLENPVPARRGHPEFYVILKDMADMLSNLRSPIEGIPDWITTFIRLGDKVSRVRGFAERTMRDGVATMAVKDESVEDTLIDLANYAILTLILYRENRA